MAPDAPTASADAPGAELQLEQDHLDRAYEALAAMRERTEQAVTAVAGDAGTGDFDAVVTEAHLRHRLRELQVDIPSLAFGRIDPDDLAAHEVGHRIGRRHVETSTGEALV